MEPSSLVVASFNVHAGVDGWGRPFDVVGACRSIDADVLVLEENWRPDGGPSIADDVAGALGYEVHELALAGGRRAGPHPEADGRWMRPFDWRGTSRALFLDSARRLPDTVTRSARFEGAQRGRWGIAVLSRLAVRDRRTADLGRLPRDRATRGTLVVWVEVGGHPVAVAGTHMTHLTYGSPLHFLRLRRLLADTVGDGPAALCGDMNLWGPPVGRLMGGWTRVVHGPSWPAWRPHSQIDHILVRGRVRALSAEVLPAAGSDHRPVRARLTLA